jgi:hypothetical protein
VRDPSPWMTWTRHHVPILYVAYGWSAVVMLLFPPVTGATGVLWDLTIAAVGGALFVVQIRHGRRYCQPCVDKTLHSDVIPSEEAERQHTALRLHHVWQNNRLLAVLFLVALIGSGFLGRVPASYGAATAWTLLGVAAAYQTIPDPTPPSGTA